MMEGDATKEKKEESKVNIGEARKKLLTSAKRITERTISVYEDVERKSAYSHIKDNLKKLIEDEKRCNRLIDEIIETGRTSKEPEAKDYEMFDHLLAEDATHMDVNDLDSVLISTIRVFTDLVGIFELAAMVKATEYEDAQTKEAFDSLRSCALGIKRNVEQAYDEIHQEW